MDRALSGAVTVDLGEMAIKEYSAIPQTFNITGTSRSDCLVSYQDIR